MDKKSLGIVIVLGVLLLGIITAVFLYDAKLNTTIIEVNGKKYDKADFESYAKVWQYENGEEPVDLETIFSNFGAYKLYTQYAEAYHVELPSGEAVTAPSEDVKTELLEHYNLSEEEYMRVKTEIATVDHLFSNLQNYWKVSEEEYNTHKEGNEDKFKMYDYRVMQVAIEPAPQSGEASGDISGDTSLEARKAAAMSKAVEALAKVKSGDSFEEVAKEYGTTRIIYSAAGIQIANGIVESISGYYMEKYDEYVDKNIKDALTTLKKGEYSKIYEGEKDSGYTFVYLEDIREGLSGADDETYRRDIANEHIQGEARIVPNRITLSSIDLEELIPALTEEHDHSHENEETPKIEIETNEVSGESNNGMESGDVSGEVNE